MDLNLASVKRCDMPTSISLGLIHDHKSTLETAVYCLSGITVFLLEFLEIVCIY